MDFSLIKMRLFIFIFHINLHTFVDAKFMLSGINISLDYWRWNPPYLPSRTITDHKSTWLRQSSRRMKWGCSMFIHSQKKKVNIDFWMKKICQKTKMGQIYENMVKCAKIGLYGVGFCLKNLRFCTIFSWFALFFLKSMFFVRFSLKMFWTPCINYI